MSILQKTLLISVLALALASCGSDTGKDTASNPYPTLPLGATGIALAPATGGDFEGKGTEPFWNIAITASGVVFIRPSEEGGIETKNYETRQEEKDGMIVVKDAKGEFFVTLKKGACSDGMSDTAYTYSANIALGAENLKGCANKK